MAETEIQSVEKSDDNAVAIYTQMDFSQLNTAIESLGDNSKELSDKEKEIGVDILKEWEGNVLEKISLKKEELENVIEFVQGKSYIDDEDFKKKVLKHLAKISNTADLLEKYYDAKNIIIAMEQNEVEQPIENPELTILQNDRVRLDFVKELSEYELEIKKAKYIMNTAFSKWFGKMKKSDQVIKIITEMDVHLNTLRSYGVECKEKSQLARLNVSISNEKVRSSIRDMIDFTKNINK